jgi:protein gp37
MSTSNIEWTGKVWNPVTGCNKVSQGCKNCYAEKMHKRLQGIKKMSGKYNRPFLDGAFPYEPDLLYPIKIKKPTTFFVNSMSDLFHASVPFEYILKVFGVMSVCKQHTFQVLTKRDDRMLEFFNWMVERDPEWMNDPAHIIYDYCVEEGIETGCGSAFETDTWPLRNVHLGVSVENQSATSRITTLSKTPAAVRMVSMEPMLEAIDLNEVEGAKELDWIIVGGESGHKRRPFNPEWARTIKEFCWENDVPFFMKQIDKVIPIPEDLKIFELPGFKKR